jgi:hypothetical protein
VTSPRTNATTKTRRHEEDHFFFVCWLLRGCILLLAVASSGCLVVTLQPAYDDQALIFEEALLGEWENSEDSTRATIERGQWRSYKITFVDRTGTRVFQGNLAKIGASTFLDLTEMRGADPGPLLVPVHTIARLAVKADEVEVALLDYDWFTRAMSRKTLGRLGTAVDDRRNAVITATTGEIKRWLAQTPAAAFAAPATFTRKQPA